MMDVVWAYRNRRATSVHVCAELAISKDDTPCLTTDLINLAVRRLEDTESGSAVNLCLTR